jgi:hypothetical protein
MTAGSNTGPLGAMISEATWGAIQPMISTDTLLPP